MRPVYQPLRRCARFTLLELLVVIAIIGILGALILPSLGKARQQGLAVNCLSHQRQIVLGLQDYAADHDDTVMPASFGDTVDSNLNHWLNYLVGRYQLDPQCICCPAMSSSECFDPDGHDPAVGNIWKEASYVMNIIKPGAWSGATGIDNPAQASGWAIDSTHPIKLNQVRHPHRAIYITDVRANIANSHLGIQSFSQTDQGPQGDDQHPVGEVRRIGKHHPDQSFNAIYGDGHAQRLLRSEATAWNVR